MDPLPEPSPAVPNTEPNPSPPIAPRVQPGILPAGTVAYQNQPSPLESANPLPRRTQTYQKLQAAEQVGVAQYLARKGGSPEDAAQIATGVAGSSLDPKNGSLIAQAIPEAEPYDSWRVLTQDDRKAALVQALMRPLFAQQAKDDVAVLARMADVINDPLPTSRVGELWSQASEGDQRARLAAKVVAGTATDSDKALMDKLGARQRLLAPAHGFAEKSFGLTVGMLPMLTKGLEYGGIAAIPGAVVGGAFGSLGGPGGTLAGAQTGARITGAVGNLYANVEAEVGNSFLEIRELKDEAGKQIDEDVARGTAAITGLVTGGIATYGAGKMLGVLGHGASAALAGGVGKTIEAAGTKAVVAAALKSPIFRDLMKQFVTQGSVGAAMEAVKILGVQAAAIVAEGKFKTPGLGASVERIGESAVSMALGGTVMHYAVSAPRMVASRMVAQAEAGHAGAKPIEAMYDLADQSKLQKRNPVALRDYLAEAAKDGNVKDLSVPLEGLQTLFEKEGVSPEQVREKMPQVAAQMREAAISGARVRVPVADFIAHIASLDKGRSLKDDLGLGDRPSVREAKAIDVEVEAAIKSVSGGGTAEAPDGSSIGRVIRDLTLKYRTEIPSSPEADVKTRVTLLAAAIESVARRSSQDPWEMFMKAPIDIHAEGLPSRAVELFLGKAKDLKTPEEIQRAASETIGERMTVWKDLSDAEHAALLAAGEKATVPEGPVLFDLPPAASSRGRPIALNILTSELKGVTAGRGAVIGEMPLARVTKGLRESKWIFDQTYRGRPVEGTDRKVGTAGYISFDTSRNWFALTLTGKANLGTFTHEGAHYTLEILRKAVYGGLANAEMTADLRTLEKWAGVPEGGVWQREPLEKFARGFQTYMGEGVAPTKGLERIFATLRSWTINVYKHLTNLGAPLTEDVRKVMDRLVTSEEAVRQISTEQHMEPMVLAPGDMTAEEHGLYLEVQQRGQREAIDRLTRQAVVALQAEKTETYKTIKREVAAKLDKDPAYNARQFFTDGTTLDGRVIPDTLKGKLDMGVVEGLGLEPRHVNALIREGLAVLGGPVHPDELAPYLGFANGTDMIRALVDAPARRTIESAEVKRQMVEIFPNYGAKDWIEKTAIESLDRDATATKITMEMMMFARKANVVPPVNPKVVAYAAAERITAERRTADTNPEQYRQAEAAAAKEKLKAYGAKDYPAAMEAARKELINGYLWRMAEQSVKKAESAKKYAERFLDKVTQAKLGRTGETIPNPMDPTAPAIREGALFRDVLAKIAENALNPYRWFMQGESAATARFDVQVALTTLEGEGYFFPRVDPIFRGSHGLKFEDMTPAQVQSFRDSLANIAHVAKNLGKLDFGTIELYKLGLTPEDLGVTEPEFLQGKISKRQVTQKLIGSMDPDLVGRLAHEYDGKRKELSKVTELAQRVRYFRAAVIKPETIWTDLDGGKPGLWHKIMFQPLKEAEMRQLVLQKAFAADHDKIVAEHPEYRKLRDERAVFVDGRTYTHAELLGVIVNLANDGNREKMFKGAEDAGRHGWNYDNVIKRLHEIFPEQKVWTLAQKLIDLAGSHKDQLFAVSERSTGVPLEPVVKRQIHTPDGSVLEGGYWPIQYDTHIPEKASPGEKTVAEKWDNFVPAAYIPKSMTKERTQAVGMMMLDPTKVLAAKTYESAHYITHFEPLVVIDQLLRSNPIRDALYKSVGEEYYRTLKNSIAYVANEGRMLTDENNAVTNFTNKLISGNAITAMGFNLKSAARQLTDVSATFSKVGPIYTTKAVTKFLVNPFSFVHDMKALSPEVDAALNAPDRDLRQMTLRTDMGDVGQAKKALVKASMYPTLYMQTIVNAITFDAGVQRGIAEGMSPAAALKYGEHMIRSSQSSGGAVDLAALQRNSDPMSRMLTSLASFTFTLNDMFMPSRMTGKEWGTKGAQIMKYAASMTMMKAAVAAVMNSDEENKARKKNMKKLGIEGETAMAAFEAAMEIVGAVPAVGRVAASALEGRPARWGTWADSFGLAARGGAGAVSDLAAGRDIKWKAATLKAAVDAAGILTTLPLRNTLFRPGEFLFELQQGHIEEPLTDLLFTPAGKIGRKR